MKTLTVLILQHLETGYLSLSINSEPQKGHITIQTYTITDSSKSGVAAKLSKAALKLATADFNKTYTCSNHSYNEIKLLLNNLIRFKQPKYELTITKSPNRPLAALTLKTDELSTLKLKESQKDNSHQHEREVYLKFNLQTGTLHLTDHNNQDTTRTSYNRHEHTIQTYITPSKQVKKTLLSETKLNFGSTKRIAVTDYNLASLTELTDGLNCERTEKGSLNDLLWFVKGVTSDKFQDI